MIQLNEGEVRPKFRDLAGEVWETNQTGEAVFVYGTDVQHDALVVVFNHGLGQEMRYEALWRFVNTHNRNKARGLRVVPRRRWWEIWK